MKKSITVVENNEVLHLITDRHGNQRYVNEFGQIHRDNGPAIINADGTEIYMQYGIVHRDENEGPAIIQKDGTVVYMKNGLHHRTNGPAWTTYIAGKLHCEQYLQEGVLHNENGPAIKFSTGSYSYYKHGKLHNEHGPATHYVDNYPDRVETRIEYALDGKVMSHLEFKVKTMRNKIFTKNKKYYKP